MRLKRFNFLRFTQIHYFLIEVIILMKEERS
jgi:hypothetical protein